MRIINTIIRMKVETVSETEVVRGITKLSGSNPRLKVCVAIASEKMEIMRKLITLDNNAT